MNVTSIIDFSSTHLEIINDGKTIYVKKAYVEVAINPDDSRIVDMFWHWYERNDGQRLFYLDFATITTPVAANAAALLALIQGYLVSQFTTSSFDPTIYAGWDANNPDLKLQPVGDGSTNLIWRQDA